MSRWRAGVLAVIATGLVAACSAEPTPTQQAACPDAPPTEASAATTLAGAERAVVVTNKGEFAIELFGDRAPLATANFVALARCGYYDGITFHRVIAGFVIQAGDPQTKTNRESFDGLGTGGPGYTFVIEPPDAGLNYDQYVVAMANALRRNSAGEIISGADSNGSQFFVDLADLDAILSRDYTIFGRVVEGTEAVETIAAVPVEDPQIGVPIDAVIITTIRIEAAPAT